MVWALSSLFDKKSQRSWIHTVSKAGCDLLKKRRYNHAILCFDKILKIKPTYFRALDGKAIAYANLKKYDEAVFWFDKAISIGSGAVPTISTKGLVLAKMGKFDDALECIQKTCQINPKCTFALRNKRLVLIEFKKRISD